MSAKKWFILLICIVALIFLAVAGLNYLADPFGLFGDKLLDWPSHNMTNNPRLAKITYLDQHHEEYDSYIIGCSLTSSYPVEALNEYYDASFYNLFTYGSDLYDVEKMARYVADNYQVKNLVVNIGLADAVVYNYESDPITSSMHAKAEGTSLARFYLKYLLVTPEFAINKLLDSRRDTYLPQSFDVFNAQTGSYDKILRDSEPIGALDSYLAANGDFAAFTPTERTLTAEQQCLDSISAIKQLCAERSINFTLLVSPIYRPVADDYSADDLARLWQELAAITDFWDFSLSSLSDDARYFYDNYHFRNALGEMALAAMFNDSSIWYPDDLATLVTADNVAQRVEMFYRPAGQPEQGVQVPILTYHHLAESGDNNATISVAAFRAQLEAVAAAGYTTVSFDDLINYVDHGAPLPDKPLLITFDDGYSSNYQLAWPILQDYGMQATVFAIGWSMGADHYKDSSKEITPHFSVEQAKEMMAEGSVSVQSHGFDAHQSSELEENPRHGLMPLSNESEADFLAWLRRDIAAAQAVQHEMGTELTVFAYPYGAMSDPARVALMEAGVRVTLSTAEHSNVVLRGLPQCLYGMGRYTMSDKVSPQQLTELLEGSSR